MTESTAVRLIDAHEVTAMTAVPRSTFRLMETRGQFPQAVKIGGRLSWVESEIQAWINQHIAARN